MKEAVETIRQLMGKFKTLKASVIAQWLQLWKGDPTIEEMAADLVDNLPYFGHLHFLGWALHALGCGHCQYMCRHVINYLKANNEQLLHGKFYKVVVFLELEASQQRETK